MFRFGLTFSLLFIYIGLLAQPQTNNWFFSSRNSLNFSTGNPVYIPGGQITNIEGASAVSDKNGSLLFYTDGITVWNRNNAVMLNGNGLAGGGSSTQSCIIVPKTKDEKQYYIFTTDDEGGSGGFEYSIVDMTLANGLGAVTIKNQMLITPCSEKITAVKHCNKKDYWVITHKYGSDAYYAYLAAENGVDPNPVISHTGSFIPITYATMAGVLKTSPDGKRIVAIHPYIGVELSDFDNQTGVLSNTHEIFLNENAHHYGAEFSASSRMLYIFIHGYWFEPDLARHSGVFQFDLSLPTIADIIISKFEVFRYNQINDVGSMQRGLNGKIYTSQYHRNYLSVINSPEVYGPGCNFVDVGFPLPNNCEANLPNFLHDYNIYKDTFQVTSLGSCINTPMTFNYTAAADITAIQWDFGDPASGFQNSSSNPNPSHTYQTGGNYTIKLITYSPCGNDTISKQISVGELQVQLGNDTTICTGAQLLITPVATGATSYQWQDGSTSPTYTALSAGLFWVQASNISNGCVRRDSLVVTNKPLPAVNLGIDTSLCLGDFYLLNAFNSGAQYTWQDNSTNSTFLVDKAGNYWVEVNLNGCNKRDSINVTILTKPQFTLGPDQYLCPGLTLQLSPGISGPGYQFLWQDGSTAPNIVASAPGLYYLAIHNSCGFARDSVNVITGNCVVYVPSGFTPNDDGLNDVFVALGTGLIKEFEMTVFDRAGQVIFQTRDKTMGWNGNYKGLKLNSGIFVYVIRYNELSDQNYKVLKGVVSLIR